MMTLVSLSISVAVVPSRRDRSLSGTLSANTLRINAMAEKDPVAGLMSESQRLEADLGATSSIYKRLEPLKLSESRRQQSQQSSTARTSQRLRISSESSCRRRMHHAVYPAREHLILPKISKLASIRQSQEATRTSRLSHM